MIDDTVTPYIMYVDDSQDDIFMVWNDSDIQPGSWDPKQLSKWFKTSKQSGGPPDMWIIKKK